MIGAGLKFAFTLAAIIIASIYMVAGTFARNEAPELAFVVFTVATINAARILFQHYSREAGL